MQQKKKKIFDKGEWLSDYTLMGNLTADTTAIMVDNIVDRVKMKPRVKMYGVDNIALFADGTYTVAVFRRKAPVQVIEEIPVSVEIPETPAAPQGHNMTSLFVAHLNTRKQIKPVNSGIYE